MYILFFSLFLTLSKADLLTTAYFTTPQTYSCSSGTPCFSATTTCNTADCYFDMKIQVPSGQRVDVGILTTSGVTAQYANWDNYAVVGNTNVNGPYYGSLAGWLCSQTSSSYMYIRVYCYSSRCDYTVSLSQTWAVADCGITWKDTTPTACDSTCTQSSQAICYYAAYSRNAPGNDVCTAALGAYVSTSTVCPISTTCGVNSVCRGPPPITCVNLCSTVNCGYYGTCIVNNAVASCSCDSCYSGPSCNIPPTGSWVNKSWSDCDCETNTQTRDSQCETSFGCVLSDSYCSDLATVTRNCTCGFTLATIISEVEGSYFYVAVLGGPSILLVCCMACILKCRKQKKSDGKYLHIHIPKDAPDPLAISTKSSPSHSSYRSPSPLPLPSSRPMAASLDSSISQSRPAAPSFASPFSQSLSRPLTPAAPRPTTPSYAGNPDSSFDDSKQPSAPQSTTEIDDSQYFSQRPPSPFSPEYVDPSAASINSNPTPTAPQPNTQIQMPPYLSQPSAPFSPEYNASEEKTIVPMNISQPDTSGGVAYGGGFSGDGDYSGKSGDSGGYGYGGDYGGGGDY